MGENADKTRDEIVQLRQEMSAKIANLRKAAERPIQLARMAAVGTVAIIVVGGVALVVVRARRRAELRTLRGRARTLAEAAAGAAADPRKTAKRARKGAEKAVDDTKDQLREQLRKELADQMKDSRPLHEKILTGAAQSAASAAIPIVLRKIQERVETAPAAAKRS